MEKWFTPLRFSLLLLLAIALVFPKVLFGMETFVYRDFGVLGYPFLFYHHESFWRGELPFWNPLSNCGAPFLAQWGTMVLYPFSLFYLLLPMPWSVNAFCLGHMLLGGIGMFRLAEKWTQHNFAAAFAGFAFVFSGLVFSCMIWPNYLVALGWMPWVVLWTEKAWLNGGAALIVASLASALQMLAGVPELAALTWLMIGPLFVADLFCRTGRGRILVSRISIIIILVTGLMAAQLLPFLDLLDHSQRAAGFASSKWTLPIWGWGNFLVPLFHCYQNAQGIFFQAGQEFFSSVYLGIPALVLGCYAALMVRHPRVWILAGLTMFCLIMSFGEDGGLYSWLRGFIPILGIARYPVKFLILPAFTLPLLAAYAIGHLQSGVRLEKPGYSGARPSSAAAMSTGSGPLRCSNAESEFPVSAPEDGRAPINANHPTSAAQPRLSDGARLFALSSLAFAGIGVILWLAYRFPLPLDQWAATWQSGVERAVILAATMALVAFATRVPSKMQWVSYVGVLSLVVLDFLTHTPNQNPTAASAALAPGLWEASQRMPAPKFGESRVMISPESEQSLLMSRVPDLYKDLLGKRLALWSNLNLLDSVPKVNGSSTLQLREQTHVQSLLYQSTNQFPKLMDFLGVALATTPGTILEWTRRASFLPLITTGQQPAFAEPTNTLQALADSAFDPQATVYLPIEAKSMITATNRTPALVASKQVSAHRIEAVTRSTEPTLVVVAQSFYHPWRAYVDDQPATLWRANYAFQALEVPAGEHRVKLVYKDRKFFTGAVISGTTLGVCVFVLVRRRKYGM